MKKEMRKSSALKALLAATLCVSMIPLPAFAGEAEESSEESTDIVAQEIESGLIDVTDDTDNEFQEAMNTGLILDGSSTDLISPQYVMVDGYKVFDFGNVYLGDTVTQYLGSWSMDVYDINLTPGTYTLTCAFSGWYKANSPVAIGIHDRNNAKVKVVTADPYSSGGSTTFTLSSSQAGNVSISLLTNNSSCNYAFRVTKNAVSAQPSWKLINGNWYYQNPNGTYWKGWHQIGGDWYYFSKSSGAAAKGLVVIDGKRYYFNPSTSEMQTGWVTLGSNSYYFTSNGAAASGLTNIGGSLYLFGSSTNKMATGWQVVGGKQYYFTASGKAASGLATIGGARYYFGPSSKVMATGWQTINGAKYYFSSVNGKAVSGMATIGGYRYYFGPSSNKMATGWQTIGGYRYYFSSVTGKAASGFVTIGDAKYYFGPSTNKMATGAVTIGSKTYIFDSITGKLIG